MGPLKKIADNTNKSYCRLPRVALFCFHHVLLLKAWASVESGVQRAMASYCMLRFQKAEGSRSTT